MADLVADLNAARPITAGGTGLNTLGAKETVLRVNSAGSALEFSPYAPYPTGHLYGLTLSNNASDATNDIDIAVGGCRDSTDAANIDLASALIKKLDAAWAVGTNQGMLDGTESVAGTPDTSTWYHIWLIKRPDTGVVDVLASESATAPTMPTNYTLKRRIGAVYNNSGGNIEAFVQYGDRFLWATTAGDVDVTNPGTSAVSRTLSTPTGVVTEAIVAMRVADVSADGGGLYLYLSSLAQADATPSDRAFSAALVGSSGGVASGSSMAQVPTNTSSQIRSRINTSNADITIKISTHGWIDTRGRI